MSDVAQIYGRGVRDIGNNRSSSWQIMARYLRSTDERPWKTLSDGKLVWRGAVDNAFPLLKHPGPSGPKDDGRLLAHVGFDILRFHFRPLLDERVIGPYLRGGMSQYFCHPAVPSSKFVIHFDQLAWLTVPSTISPAALSYVHQSLTKSWVRIFFSSSKNVFFCLPL